MEVITQVRLREMGSVFCCRAEGLQIKNNDLVIVEVERGIDYGRS